MKIIACLSVLLLLTSCAKSSKVEIKEEEMKEKYAALMASVSNFGSAFDDIRANQNQGFTYEYRYKKDEFYSFRDVALVIIVPINIQDFTWKENDKYYHCEIRLSDDRTYKKEITQEQYVSYMDKHRQSMKDLLMNPVEIGNERINNQDKFKSVLNKCYYDKSIKQYRFESQATIAGEEGQEDKTSVFIMWFDENRPYSYAETISGESGSTTWNFTYDATQFEQPSDPRIDG